MDTVQRAGTRTEPPPQAWTIVGGAFLLVAGLMSDGWAHTHRLAELESFLTPFHAAIFAGYLVAAAGLGRAVLRRSGDLDPAYRRGLIAIVTFGAGFLGDGIWHTAFGIEADIEALLSPTHLLMFGSALVLFAVPVSYLWSHIDGRRLDPGSLRIIVVASTLIMTTIAFFLLFA